MTIKLYLNILACIIILSCKNNPEFKVESITENKDTVVIKIPFGISDTLTQKGIIDYKNLKQGTWITLNNEGFIVGETRFKDGIKHGLFVSYNPDGKEITQIGSYNNGKLNGPFLVFHENNTPAEYRNYKDGEFNGIQKIWTKSGKLLHFNEYKDGLRHQLQISFNPYGDTLVKSKYDHGSLIFEKTINKDTTDWLRYFKNE